MIGTPDYGYYHTVVGQPIHLRGCSNFRGHFSDGDRLGDNFEAQIGTDPTKKDTDGDGYSDKEEVDEGSDPLLKESQSEEQPTSNLLLLVAAMNAQKAPATDYNENAGTYILDNGTGGGAVSCGNTAHDLEWATQFFTDPADTTITEIMVAFGGLAEDAGITTPAEGEAIQVRIYNDVNNDGQPNDLVEQAIIVGTIANYCTDTFNAFDTPDTDV